jgi:hypothetical protein
VLTPDGDRLYFSTTRATRPYASSGVPVGPEFRINTYTTDYQLRPSVAKDAAGNFVVVWHSSFQEGQGPLVFGQRYSAAGAPLGTEFRVSRSSTNSDDSPDVASDADGNFVVTWKNEQAPPPIRGIHAQRFASSGVPLGPEFRVNTFVTNYQDRPSVASDSIGNFVVTWQSYGQDGSGNGIFGQRYSQIVPAELMQFRVE